MMRRPLGIKILAFSFFGVAVLLVIWLNLYGISVLHLLLVVAGHLFAIGVAGIGVGLLARKSSARWTAFVCLAFLVLCGFMATLFDTLAHQGPWMALDFALLILLVLPATYLLMPGVEDYFVQAKR